MPFPTIQKTRREIEVSRCVYVVIYCLRHSVANVESNGIPVYFKWLSNQSMKLRCQRRLFCGFSTQWVSSGK